MKQLLLFIALLCSVWAKGQNNSIFRNNSLPNHEDSIVNGWIVNDNYDTVKCLILYCDTTWMQYSAFSSFGVFAMCKKGYEVVKIRPEPIFSYGDEPQEPNHIYLDANKKPLPKSYIVWQVKRLK